MQNIVSETLGRSITDRLADSVFTAGLTVLSYLALGPVRIWVITHPVRAVVVGASGYFVAAIAVVIAVRMKRKYSENATQLANWGWLNNIKAKQDINPLVLQRQRVTRPTPSCSYYLKQEDGPRMELSLYMFNGSSWPLHVERLEGHITFGGIALRRQPELFGGRDIGYGSEGLITVKQWLDVEQLGLLKQKVEQINDDHLILDLHNLKITISGNPKSTAGIEPVEYVLPLTDGYSVDTQRVFRR